MLRVIDAKWMDHIDSMDQLKKGIVLKAYGNQDPVIAYKKAGFEMFEEMTAKCRRRPCSSCARKYRKRAQARGSEVEYVETAVTTRGVVNSPVVNSSRTVGRNELCPCGSGKKYKNCCLGKDLENKR